jgi:uncharacterized membrane protein YfcA
LPAFAIFFPVPIAVAATAVVHLTTNLLKGALLYRQADRSTVIRFGATAVPAAIVGAWLLARLDQAERVFVWTIDGRTYGPTAAGVTVGALMVLFAVLEMHARFQRLAAPARWLPIGGLLSGFVGGLTGQQGALRSMFLLKTGLEPSRFIATGVMLAILVDLSRLPTYVARFRDEGLTPTGEQSALVAVATACALCGALLGVRSVRKVTLPVVRAVVAIASGLVGMALIAGVIGS